VSSASAAVPFTGRPGKPTAFTAQDEDGGSTRGFATHTPTPDWQLVPLEHCACSVQKAAQYASFAELVGEKQPNSVWQS
jgi:hypothetical protein